MELEANEVEFFSEHDEKSFFSWLRSIEAVKNVYGRGLSIFIEVQNIDKQSLMELISIFHRYNIEMTQLAALRNNDNEKWYYDKKMFWFRLIFQD